MAKKKNPIVPPNQKMRLFKRYEKRINQGLKPASDKLLERSFGKLVKDYYKTPDNPEKLLKIQKKAARIATALAIKGMKIPSKSSSLYDYEGIKQFFHMNTQRFVEDQELKKIRKITFKKEEIESRQKVLDKASENLQRKTIKAINVWASESAAQRKGKEFVELFNAHYTIIMNTLFMKIFQFK